LAHSISAIRAGHVLQRDQGGADELLRAFLHQLEDAQVVGVRHLKRELGVERVIEIDGGELRQQQLLVDAELSRIPPDGTPCP
jgi:hypothetical protein